MSTQLQTQDNFFFNKKDDKMKEQRIHREGPRGLDIYILGWSKRES